MGSLPAKLSIVTPSYNQSPFLEDSISSVLGQSYPNLEYIIVDAGSVDGSVDIIQNHAEELAWWESEPNRGLYDALNKGFSRSTGEIMAWLNSDDKYTPWAFQVVEEIFRLFPQIQWVTTMFPMFWDRRGYAISCGYSKGFAHGSFLRGGNLPGMGWHASSFIQQESTFWRRSLWERAGAHVDDSLEYAGDFELWARFWNHTELWGVGVPLGGFRVHRSQKTALHGEEYQKEAIAVLRSHGSRPYGRFESSLRSHFLDYVPHIIRPPLTRLGLTYQARICVNNAREGRWRIVTTYLV